MEAAGEHGDQDRTGNFISSVLKEKQGPRTARPTQPPTVVCKMEAQSEYVYTLHTRFCMFGTDLYAQSVLINKNFCIKSSVQSLLRVRGSLGSRIKDWCNTV